MKAKFAGGPLDGREIELPGDQPALEVHASRAVPTEPRGELQMAGGFTRYVIGNPPRVRYALHFQRRGVAHYYIPTGER